MCVWHGGMDLSVQIFEPRVQRLNRKREGPAVAEGLRERSVHVDREQSSPRLLESLVPTTVAAM